MKNLLELKNKVKSRKPRFVRQDYNKELFKNIDKWRKPRGLHNKRRLNKKGHQKNPAIGYKSPRLVRGLHKSGIELIYISNIKDINKIKNENQAAVLSSNLGNKSKLSILEICLKNKIRVFNIKNPEEYIKKVKESLEKKKADKKKRETKKKEAREKAEKKKEEKKEDKQEEIKEDIMESKQEIKQDQMKEIQKIDKKQSKAGHMASSVPGTRQ